MIKLRQKNKYDSSYKLLKDKGSGSEGEETELFVRNKKKTQRTEFPTEEKVIEEGDTLQALAIKYHCSVAELKRINNIHNENEIYAKISIKVPHRPFTSALASVHNSGNNSPDRNTVPSSSNLIDIDSVTLKLTEDLTPQKQDQVNEIIFNSEFAQKPSDRLCSKIVNDDEQVRLLPQVTNAATIDPISRFNCNGADGGISWKLLVVLIILLIVALPLIIILRVVEDPEEYLHHNGS